jgi:hypothetical protein
MGLFDMFNPGGPIDTQMQAANAQPPAPKQGLLSMLGSDEGQARLSNMAGILMQIGSRGGMGPQYDMVAGNRAVSDARTAEQARKDKASATSQLLRYAGKMAPGPERDLLTTLATTDPKAGLERIGALNTQAHNEERDAGLLADSYKREDTTRKAGWERDAGLLADSYKREDTMRQTGWEHEAALAEQARALAQQQRDAYLRSIGLEPPAAAPSVQQSGGVTPIPTSSVKQAVPPGPAPVVQAPQPVVQAPQPAVQAPQPVVQAPQPAVQAPAPIDPFTAVTAKIFGPDASLDADQQMRLKAVLASPTMEKDLPGVIKDINTENTDAAKQSETFKQSRDAQNITMTSNQATAAQAVHQGVATKDAGYSAIKDSAEQLAALDLSKLNNAQKIQVMYKYITGVLDPKGSARETDADLINSAQSLMGRAEQMAAKAASGQPVNKELISEMYGEMIRLGADAETRQEKLRREATKAGVARGLPKDKARDMIFGDTSVDMTDFVPSIKVPVTKNPWE